LFGFTLGQPTKDLRAVAESDHAARDVGHLKPACDALCRLEVEDPNAPDS